MLRFGDGVEHFLFSADFIRRGNNKASTHQRRFPNLNQSQKHPISSARWCIPGSPAFWGWGTSWDQKKHQKTKKNTLYLAPPSARLNYSFHTTALYSFILFLERKEPSVWFTLPMKLSIKASPIEEIGPQESWKGFRCSVFSHPKVGWFFPFRILTPTLFGDCKRKTLPILGSHSQRPLPRFPRRGVHPQQTVRPTFCDLPADSGSWSQTDHEHFAHHRGIVLLPPTLLPFYLPNWLFNFTLQIDFSNLTSKFPFQIDHQVYLPI